MYIVCFLCSICAYIYTMKIPFTVLKLSLCYLMSCVFYIYIYIYFVASDQKFPCKPAWPSSKAWGELVDIVHLIPGFGFPFSSQDVVYGRCLVTVTHNHLVAVSWQHVYYCSKVAWTGITRRDLGCFVVNFLWHTYGRCWARDFVCTFLLLK